MGVGADWKGHLLGADPQNTLLEAPRGMCRLGDKREENIPGRGTQGTGVLTGKSMSCLGESTEAPEGARNTQGHTAARSAALGVRGAAASPQTVVCMPTPSPLDPLLSPGRPYSLPGQFCLAPIIPESLLEASSFILKSILLGL